MFSPRHALLPQLSSEQEVCRKYRKDGPVVSVLEWYLGDAGSFTIQAACFLFDLGIAGCLELTCTIGDHGLATSLGFCEGELYSLRYENKNREKHMSSVQAARSFTTSV